jgi:anaerobic selenocysteine-containing dehydrogenase
MRRRAGGARPSPWWRYDIPPGSAAAYYPEANVLVALDDHDQRSGTPAYKSVPVRLRKHRPESANVLN